MVMLYKWVKHVQSLLYPPICLLCRARGLPELDICEACKAALPRVLHVCKRCAIPLPAADLELCGSCQREPPHFDAAIAPFHYSAPIDRLIQRLKFDGELTCARLLGTLTAAAISTDASPISPELIVPVPLHAKRLRERGFNQSLELARYIGTKLGAPVDNRSVQRAKLTTPQMELPAKARRSNIRNAFQITGKIAAKHVAIVDDVVTTGATVNELARTLRKAGVECIQVWSCARAD